MEDTLQTLVEHLTVRRWVLNLEKIQGPSTITKFWGVVWSGKMCVVPEAVIDKLQPNPTPKNVKEVCTF